MSEEERRNIASKGGKAAHQSGNAHEWDSEEAREAGRRGGQARSQNQNATGQNGQEGTTEETL